MKKQEKIREAYGEHWETVKYYVDENGWCNAFFGIAGLFQHDVIFKKGLIVKWRPKTLARIEDNNGWIKIESEDDLPKDAIKKETRFWLSLNKISFIGYFYKSYGGLNFCCADLEGLPKVIVGIHIGKAEKLDGYQPIVKPQPPIY